MADRGFHPDERARKAILQLMFGKSAEEAEKNLPILLELWGMRTKNKTQEHG